MARWLQKVFGRAPAPGETSLDLFPNDRPEFYEDPYPFYEVLRRDHPFYRTHDGTWVLSRYPEVKDALDHPSLGNAPSRFSTLHPAKSDRYVCANLANNIMPFLDGPAHKEQRRQVARVFQQEVKAFPSRLNERAVRAVANLGKEVEVIGDFAHPFALGMICDLLGIPVDSRLRDWSSSFFYLFTKIPTAAVRSEVDRHLTAFRARVAACFDDPADQGVLPGLARLVETGELDRAVAIDTMILLFADGLENVDSGIGNAIRVFAAHPEQWHGLCRDISLLDGTVDELLRFDSPAQYIARTCLEDFEWHGRHFKKDLNVILLLASANRDEGIFDRPARFDITRSPKRHLAFGHGKHSCLGSRLVEQELAAILGELRTKVSAFSSTGPVRWQKRTGHRWMEEARFRFTPAESS